MAIDAITSAASTYTTGTDRIPKKSLGQEEFFKLLSTQLASQDPLKPMEDTDFIAQMSSFSSLEMMSQLNNSFSEFTGQQNFLAVQSMLGRSVTVMKSGTEQVTGLATAIHNDNGETLVTIDGEDYPVSNILRVEVNG